MSFPRVYGFSPEKTAEAIALFHEYYDRQGIYENRPYPGIPALLEQLKIAGKQVALATSKPLNLAERVLHHLICGSILTRFVAALWMRAEMRKRMSLKTR